jgi:hypothetical protein
MRDNTLFFSGTFAEYATNADSLDSLDVVEMVMAIEEKTSKGNQLSPEDIACIGHVKEKLGANWPSTIEEMEQKAKEELARHGLGVDR